MVFCFSGRKYFYPVAHKVARGRMVLCVRLKPNYRVRLVGMCGGRYVWWPVCAVAGMCVVDELCAISYHCRGYMGDMVAVSVRINTSHTHLRLMPLGIFVRGCGFVGND